ncbi:hypothetical protein THASP1DRAFT_27461 [Thamnocephalis sphaerospora]|uniref:Uncharacterized protein n=1 Tax=Thamnocephalis sphaerospora TaxID=78915 RepID=A0A4P9XXI9_9FUNG|nr:hypothetical protein THASP1DRAFT_27461 [Thamnocephalis sphaerospora]|eukprot:RKP10752.1 hypothetical protein THASP1DRAFT_27461 [Thamnocephalis sphaerospora]
MSQFAVAFTFLLSSLVAVVHAADKDVAKNAAGGSDGSSANYTTIGIALAIGGTAFLAVLAVGLFLYRRRRAQALAQTKPSGTTFSASSPRVPRQRRSSSILLRHAVQNKSALATAGPSMKRNNRRKAPPSAIMVEVPPASLTVEMNTLGSGQLQVQRTVGLHVPPSPAYDFRGRSGDLPVTPRTPCMSFTAPSNADADRMVSTDDATLFSPLRSPPRAPLIRLFPSHWRC